MAQTLLELTASIVSAHASVNEMTSDELLQEIQKVFGSLQKLEGNIPGGEAAEAAPAGPAVSLKKAFQPDQVLCMVCGKGGFKTLTRHLSQAHAMKPREYRKQFGIPSGQSLTAKNFSEARRRMASERGLAENLAKARAARAAGKAVVAKPPKKEAPAKAKAIVRRSKKS
jgi:predicted transcriptional regulator